VGEPPEVSYNEDSDHGLLNEDRYQCNELNALLNNYSFFFFLKILDLPLRTAGVKAFSAEFGASRSQYGW